MLVTKLQTEERSSAGKSQRNPNRFRPKYNFENPIQEAQSTPMVELLFPGSSLKNYSVDLNQQRPTLNKPAADRRKSEILPAKRRDQILNNHRNQNPSGQERPSFVRPNQNLPNSPNLLERSNPNGHERPNPSGQERSVLYERPNQKGKERSVLYERPTQNGQERSVFYERPNQIGHERSVFYERPNPSGQERPISHERPTFNKRDNPIYVERQTESTREKSNPFLLKKDIPTRYQLNYQDSQSQRYENLFIFRLKN